MRIAIFHTTLPETGRKLGGVEVAVHRLADELARDPGNSVTVFSVTPAPSQARYDHTQLFPSWTYLHRSRLLRLLLLPALLNLVHFRDFDILHLHGDDWFFIRRTIPTVRTLHGSAIKEAQAATSLKRRIAQYGVYPLEHASARLATRCMAVGPLTKDIYRASYLADNGVDLDLFRPGEKTDAPSIIFVGTWTGRKRGNFLFDVFTDYVLPRNPNAVLYMVTDYAPAHERVMHFANPSDADIAKLYRKAWVFAYPSVYEGFGIPYLEALASGTAVLASYNDGASYVLEAGAYGIIADDRDFGSRLVELLNDAEMRRSMAHRGRLRAEKFSWSTVARQHSQVYRKAIESWQNRRNVFPSSQMAAPGPSRVE